MLHIEILHIKILLLLEFSRQQPPGSVRGFSLRQWIYYYVDFSYFRKAKDWVAFEMRTPLHKFTEVSSYIFTQSLVFSIKIFRTVIFQINT